MNKSSNFMRIFQTIIILGFLASTVIAYSQIDSDLQMKVNEVYNAINAASTTPEDVADLVELLNRVIEFLATDQMSIDDATVILDQIIADAQQIEQQRIQQDYFRLGLIATNTLVVLMLCYFMWRYFCKR